MQKAANGALKREVQELSTNAKVFLRSPLAVRRGLLPTVTDDFDADGKADLLWRNIAWNRSRGESEQ